jgi:segregation and condensation protein A
MNYHVQTESFEGPLELLLDLIDKNKLSINEVSLAAIADQYISYVKNLETFKPQEVASFLVVAATLMLAKSRSLLPQLELTKEEEGDIQELEDRLQTYRRLRELTHHIDQCVRAGRHMYTRSVPSDLPTLFYPPESLTLESMTSMMRTVIDALPQKEFLPEKTVQAIVSIEERMDELEKRIQKKISMSFSSFVGRKKEKVEIIISFLAMLELIKQGTMLAEQNGLFGDIALERK